MTGTSPAGSAVQRRRQAMAASFTFGRTDVLPMESDIPDGMTIREYRRQLAAQKKNRR